MIKQLSEKMRNFSIGTPKENYTFDEVQRYLEDQKKGLVSYFDGEVSAELEKLASDKKSLTTEYEALDASFKKLNEEKEGLGKSVEALQTELKPFKENSKAEKAKTILKGKVALGAEVDAFNLLDLSKLEEIEEEKQEQFINESVAKLLEEKSYLKPTVDAPGGEKPDFVQDVKKTVGERVVKPSPRRF